MKTRWEALRTLRRPWSWTCRPTTEHTFTTSSKECSTLRPEHDPIEASDAWKSMPETLDQLPPPQHWVLLLASGASTQRPSLPSTGNTVATTGSTIKSFIPTAPRLSSVYTFNHLLLRRKGRPFEDRLRLRSDPCEIEVV